MHTSYINSFWTFSAFLKISLIVYMVLMSYHKEVFKITWNILVIHQPKGKLSPLWADFGWHGGRSRTWLSGEYGQDKMLRQRSQSPCLRGRGGFWRLGSVVDSHKFWPAKAFGGVLRRRRRTRGSSSQTSLSHFWGPKAVWGRLVHLVLIAEKLWEIPDARK